MGPDTAGGGGGGGEERGLWPARWGLQDGGVALDTASTVCATPSRVRGAGPS